MEDPYKEPAATLKQRKPFSIFYINSIFITCVVFFILIIVLIQQNTVHDNTRPPSCQHPTTRQEWRRLSPTEKQNYIDAVRCLETVPSRLYPNRSIYDDFPWTHIHNSNSSHGTAAFLAWHRYFIHVYETALRERCKYTGTLTYWDWTLDWKDMTRSPVWDTELGFGGNGNLSTEPSVGVGHCVTDGPFANLQVLFYGLDENRHCLSRHFRNGQDFHHLCSYPIRLEAIQTLLRAENYESFNLELEDGAHHAIPNCIRGDWLRLTVPYDPVFFLHHTQIDRLWWIWQQKDLETRSRDYVGIESDDSGESASLGDIIDLGQLSAQVTVSEVMRTESDLLCYRY